MQADNWNIDLFKQYESGLIHPLQRTDGVCLSGPTREQMEAGVPGAELRDREWEERGEESWDRKLSAEVTVM